MQRSTILFVIVMLFVGTTSAMRVVSLGPSVTGTMTALGIESMIVGRTQYCELSASSKSVVVGSMLEINVESLVALKPDRVFAVGLTPQKVVDKIRRLGIPVTIVDDPASYAMLCQNLRTVAKECGVASRAEKIIAEATQRVERVRKKYATHAPKTVMIQLVANPPYVVLDGTLGGEMIKIIGGVNAFGNLTNGYVSREAVLSVNPQVIILPDMDGHASAEVAQWKRFPQLAAVKRKAIYVVRSRGIGSPSVPLFAQTVEELGVLIHGW